MKLDNGPAEVEIHDVKTLIELGIAESRNYFEFEEMRCWNELQNLNDAKAGIFMKKLTAWLNLSNLFRFENSNTGTLVNAILCVIALWD